MGEPGIWAVLPIKRFSEAKQRLGTEFDLPFRAGLAHAMVEDVLAALAGSRRLAGILVVTVDPQAAALARRYGTVVSDKDACAGQTAAIRSAAARLTAEGRGGMLTIPGDVPGITAGEIDDLIAAHPPAPSFTIAPAHDGRGSNAIIVSPPDRVSPSYGNDSFEPHLAAARASGIEPNIVQLPGIGLDIDNPDDLRAFLPRIGGARTRAYLAERGLFAGERAVP